MTIAQRFKEIRLSNKKTWQKRVKVAGEYVEVDVKSVLSQRDLSDELGYRFNYISYIESGVRKAPLHVIHKFCSYYKISLSKFFKDIEGAEEYLEKKKK